LLPKGSASAIFMQTLAKRWWDTTHTFHITDQEMSITPHDFHYMTDLWFDRVSVSLKGESSTRLGLELLGRRYAMEIIHYTNHKANFMCHL